MQGRPFSMPSDMQLRDTTVVSLDPGADPIAVALAGVLKSIGEDRLRADASMGLTPSSFAAMTARYFPGGLTARRTPQDAQAVPDEFDDLVALFLEHRAHDGPEVEWLAHAIACGCMGGDHLYQDMGLPNRQALSDLLRRHFTALFEKNTGNMKWKKFFYKQLCDRAEVKACSAPSCQVCSDYRNCFLPEEPVLVPANLSSGE